MSCNITKQQIHKSLLDKSFEIALTKNKAYFINGRGEIGLMVNPKVISENTPYRVRQKIDILSRKLAKDLNIPIDKYGVVFGGKTYTDGAALEIIVTPRLLEAYQVKNNEKKIEDAFVEEAISEVKKGVPELFESNPELASVGTPQQYSQYLETIFPDSKVKDIVYHGTDKELKEFYDNLRSGIHFGTLKQAEGRRRATDFEFKRNAKFIPAIIDLKNPLKTKDFDWEKAGDAFTFWQPGDDLSDLDFTEYLISSGIIKKEEIQDAEGDFDLINKKGYDSVIYKNEGAGETTGENSYAVSKSEQIHILGSKQDIEGFKEFVSITQTPAEKQDSKSELKRDARFEITKLGDGQFLYAGDIYPSREDAFRAFEEDNTPSIQEAQIPISQMDRIIDNLPPFTGDMEDLGFEEEACDL